MTILVLTSRHVVLPLHDQPVPATIQADPSTGKILSIELGYAPSSQQSWPTDTYTLIDAGDLYILPGLVDRASDISNKFTLPNDDDYSAHVHLNEPGRTDWEGFATGTQAAVAGGVTTVVDMPLNSIPPTTTVKNLEIKRDAARGQCWSDVAFWGGIIPGNQDDLLPLLEAGVKGFKCFLINSGVEEFPNVEEHDLSLAMQKLENTDAALLFHAELELDEHKADDDKKSSSSDPHDYATFLASRPQEMELSAIQLVTRLQASYPSVRCHIVHLTASSALPLLRRAKQTVGGSTLTVETCFHYLTFLASDVPRGRPEFKCCPPIRDERNREALWEALGDGTIDFVVSDHSPCVASLKEVDGGDFMKAWGGVSGLGLGLSALWTGAKKRGYGIREVVRWTCENTAVHARLHHRKGKIQVGYDADLILWDPDKEIQISKDEMHFKNKLSPFEGVRLLGEVQQTFVRGVLAWSRDSGFQKPLGQLL
ncbi:hypothetical protein FRC17_000737 [Serendipita sp. 399]|nr:hypothetical protein FRC17_000737 [Serendipita sp. 399]